MTTLNDIIQETIKELSMVPGQNVQVYAEDRVALAIRSAFDLAFSEIWYDEYMSWFTRTLDGVAGIVTADMDNVNVFGDIRAIFVPNSDRPLPVLPRDINPFRLTGTTPIFIEGRNAPERPFTVWPLTATGTVHVHARVRPATFDLTDVIAMDELFLRFAAAWMISEDDGNNPGATQKFQTLMDRRFTQLKNKYNNKPIILDPAVPQNTNEWFER